MSDGRSIELEIEVNGTPEEVWEAIGSGPGISSWYVPHVVEGREGGAFSASFGPGPEMQVAGRVAAWDPPRRVAFDGGGADAGLAFEWTVEARDNGRCVVRLVNSGFLDGSEWDAQYDAMHEGWQIFLHHLALHCEHFRGRAATAALPMATWAGPAGESWQRLTHDLAVDPSPSVGDRVEIRADATTSLSGVVTETTAHRISLLVDGPDEGTAFLTAEDVGGVISVSIWSYLYGPSAPTDQPDRHAAWQAWLDERAVPGDRR